MPYEPIENHGIIGNMHTAALVSLQANIDFLCFPSFHSPALFCSMLDDHHGGHWSVAPSDLDDAHINHKQFYWPETNVLVTRFLAECGVGQVNDYMPVNKNPGEYGYRSVIRTVKVARGKMKFKSVIKPSFNFAKDDHSIELNRDSTVAMFRSKDLVLSVVINVKKDACIDITHEGKALTVEFELEEDEEPAVFSLFEYTEDHECIFEFSHADEERLFDETVQYWQRWLTRCTYRGRWREVVHRSALTMKLLTYQPTGAIIAALTTSLPEELGGVRNWDYRYTWIRDAAFTLYGFMRIGFTEEAKAFMHFIENRCIENGNGQLKIMYAIDGSQDLTEEILDHLEGYRGSYPVRRGNEAHGQLQLDIYGELMDSVYLYDKYGAPISYDMWRQMCKVINYVCDHWNLPDDGVWEVRGGRQHFVYSKLMCWVAIDRAIRLSNKRSLPAPRDKWLHVRDEIYEWIMTNGWDEERGSFIQSAGSKTLDASLLTMPLVLFSSPTDPRMLKTIDAIKQKPQNGGLMSNGLVYRYNAAETQDVEGGGEEGTFNICTFWMIEALTRAGRHDPDKLREARLLFESMLGYSNHLGLYAEETGKSGEALGNFPQAFTHLSLISAAYNLDRVLNETHG
eukprot:gb/GECH01005998.1/.p1 GENE.gb/GECH01005998.1/~~gb/GECH01005998.1/.p1  ORF type:complete len:625 (+),score=132.20 gb/GECH01005998.1/:1-1875(+)